MDDLDLIINARSIRKTFTDKNGKKERVLDIPSLQIPRGRVIAVVGDSGLGKSTLLNILAGLDTPDSGATGWARWNTGAVDLFATTRDWRWRKAIRVWRRRSAFIFQHGHLLRRCSQIFNLRLARCAAWLPPEPQKLRSILRDVWDGSHRKPEDSFYLYPVMLLSGGESQRISLGRAFAREPTIIFADEPASNLDRKSGREIMLKLRKWVEDGAGERTAIVVTHQTELALCAHGVILLHKGSTGTLNHGFPGSDRPVSLCNSDYSIESIDGAISGASQSEQHVDERLRFLNSWVERPDPYRPWPNSKSGWQAKPLEGVPLTEVEVAECSLLNPMFRLARDLANGFSLGWAELVSRSSAKVARDKGRGHGWAALLVFALACLLMFVTLFERESFGLIETQFDDPRLTHVVARPVIGKETSYLGSSHRFQIETAIQSCIVSTQDRWFHHYMPGIMRRLSVRIEAYWKDERKDEILDCVRERTVDDGTNPLNRKSESFRWYFHDISDRAVRERRWTAGCSGAVKPFDCSRVRAQKGKDSGASSQDRLAKLIEAERCDIPPPAARIVFPRLERTPYVMEWWPDSLNAKRVPIDSESTRLLWLHPDEPVLERLKTYPLTAQADAYGRLEGDVRKERAICRLERDEKFVTDKMASLKTLPGLLITKTFFDFIIAKIAAIKEGQGLPRGDARTEAIGNFRHSPIISFSYSSEGEPTPYRVDGLIQAIPRDRDGKIFGLVSMTEGVRHDLADHGQAGKTAVENLLGGAFYGSVYFDKDSYPVVFRALSHFGYGVEVETISKIEQMIHITDKLNIYFSLSTSLSIFLLVVVISAFSGVYLSKNRKEFAVLTAQSVSSCVQVTSLVFQFAMITILSTALASILVNITCFIVQDSQIFEFEHVEYSDIVTASIWWILFNFSVCVFSCILVFWAQRLKFSNLANVLMET